MPPSLSRLGLGLAAIGRPGYINLGHDSDLGADRSPKAMEAAAHRVLDAAWDAGVRYFDAARSYGRAEAFLASWLRSRNIAPADVIIGSKWGYTYTADWQVEAEKHEIKDHTLPTLLRQYAESQANLGPYLKLYQIHSATLDSGVLDDRAVLTELARLRSTGLRIGLSLSGSRQAETLRRAMQVSVDGERVFDSVQATWNLLEPSAGSTLAEAHDAGMTVIVKEALANGRLTPRNSDAEFADMLSRIAGEYRTTVDAVCLASVLSQPWADIVLSGAATAEHVRSNVAAAALTLEESALAQLGAIAENSDQYWATRSRLIWN